jgi:nucleotide-binding universal stress UspA family protein
VAKKYMLRIGDRSFVFSNVKVMTTAMEALDMAEFVGHSSWRHGSALNECEPCLETQVFDTTQVKLLKMADWQKAEAIDSYRRAKKSDAEKRLANALKELQKFGVDPASVPVEEEE